MLFERHKTMYLFFIPMLYKLIVFKETWNIVVGLKEHAKIYMQRLIKQIS